MAEEDIVRLENHSDEVNRKVPLSSLSGIYRVSIRRDGFKDITGFMAPDMLEQQLRCGAYRGCEIIVHSLARGPA